MASKIEIFNMALGYVGTGNIASEHENTPVAIQCKLYWNTARKTTLRDYAWNFAQKRVYLAQIQTPQIWANSYNFAYFYPADCLKIHNIVNERTNRECLFSVVTNDKNERIVLTETEAAIANYTADVENIFDWDDQFIFLMSRKLAALVASALLKNNPSKASELEQYYRLELPTALKDNAQERNEKEPVDSWIAMRG